MTVVVYRSKWTSSTSINNNNSSSIIISERATATTRLRPLQLPVVSTDNNFPHTLAAPATPWTQIKGRTATWRGRTRRSRDRWATSTAWRYTAVRACSVPSQPLSPRSRAGPWSGTAEPSLGVFLCEKRPKIVDNFKLHPCRDKNNGVRNKTEAAELSFGLCQGEDFWKSSNWTPYSDNNAHELFTIVFIHRRATRAFVQVSCQACFNYVSLTNYWTNENWLVKLYCKYNPTSTCL